MTSHGHFHWNELATRDVEKAKKFYADTLGWTYEGMPMPEGTYWVASAGGEPVAGIVDAGSDGTPESWMSYIAVDDVDARAKKGGASGRQGRAAGLRYSRRRSHRHPGRARRRQHRLDDAGE